MNIGVSPCCARSCTSREPHQHAAHAAMRTHNNPHRPHTLTVSVAFTLPPSLANTSMHSLCPLYAAMNIGVAPSYIQPPVPNVTPCRHRANPPIYMLHHASPKLLPVCHTHSRSPLCSHHRPALPASRYTSCRLCTLQGRSASLHAAHTPQ